MPLAPVADAELLLSFDPCARLLAGFSVKFFPSHLLGNPGQPRRAWASIFQSWPSQIRPGWNLFLQISDVQTRLCLKAEKSLRGRLRQDVLSKKATIKSLFKPVKIEKNPTCRKIPKKAIG